MPEGWYEQALAKAKRRYAEQIEALRQEGIKQDMGVLQFWHGKQWQAILSPLVPTGEVRSEFRS